MSSSWKSAYSWVGAAILFCGAMLTACSSTLVGYVTEERQGNIQVIFINNTSARASFSFGSYDALDKDPPGTVTLQQLRLEAAASSAAATLACRRDVAVGTAELVKRVTDTRTDLNTANFDADAFDSTVHFSTAPQGSASAALPDAGTAAGSHKRLGVEFTCGDTLIFTFQEDADAPGGFRIDFTVIPDREADDIQN